MQVSERYDPPARSSIPGTALLLGILLLWPASARAQDAFEIQVYDAQTAAPREVGLEVHLNFNAVGVRTRGSAGELPTDHVFHLTFEPHLGLAGWGELGFYFQTAVRPSGEYDYAGVKLRFKARVPWRIGGMLGLAANAEVSIVPRAYDGQVYGSELRLIADVQWKRLYVSINPIFGFDLAGALIGRPQLQPAAKLAVQVVSGWAMGAEYYAVLGPLEAILPASQQVHRVFAVTDLEWHALGKEWGLNLGVGYGWAAGERWIVKAIVGMALPP